MISTVQPQGRMGREISIGEGSRDILSLLKVKIAPDTLD